MASTQTSASPTVVVIGAGLAGLTAAKALRAAGVHVTLLEKSRGVSGRLSTRRVREPGPAEGCEFDHGAPAVHVRRPAFQAAVDALTAQGAMCRWPHDGSYVGVPGMNRAFAALADGVDLILQARAERLTRTTDGWRVAVATPTRTDDTATHLASAVIVATPALQAAALLRIAAPDLAERAAMASMDPCWTVMVAVRPGAMNHPAGDVAPFVPDTTSMLDVIVRNDAKPQRTGTGQSTWHTLVAHARPDWSETNLERAAEDVLGEILPVVCRATGLVAGDVLYAAAHRWRYARTRIAAGTPTLARPDGTLAVCGDWLLGREADDAHASGSAAAAAVLTGLGLG